jgi:hypothetical protein
MQMIVDCSTGQVTEAPFTLPDPPRRLIPKPVLLERVRAEGGDLLSNVYSIMYAPTDEARDALTRWNMPGYPDVYFDDADTLGVLTLAGASEEQKARITAPT